MEGQSVDGGGNRIIKKHKAPDAKARQREAARARVMHIFRHTADDPAAQPLLHAVLAFREEQLK